jgi:hypothetical protein
LFVIRVVLLLIFMFYVLFMCKCVLPPGVNPTAVDKYIKIREKIFEKRSLVRWIIEQVRKCTCNVTMWHFREMFELSRLF